MEVTGNRLVLGENAFGKHKVLAESVSGRTAGWHMLGRAMSQACCR